MRAVQLSDLDYDLPPELVALHPAKERTASRLLAVDRETAALEHLRFFDLPGRLRPGDLLVLNDSRVFPARIFAKRRSGGRVEIFLLKQTAAEEWTALVRPGRRVKAGEILNLGENGTALAAEILGPGAGSSGERTVRFRGSRIPERLREIGHVPLPPYISRPDTEEDRVRYQTVFARKEGSVAAPTAGLHFDKALLEKLEGFGVEIVRVTLHVNYATFKMIEEQDVSRHPMHEEEFEISTEAADRINLALAEKRRVIACGTTSVRVLETAAAETGQVKAQRGTTRIFIYGDYRFRAVSGLVTNFHLPRSTLLCLVDAFLGPGRWRAVYEEAIREKYRFYSYGDAMIIL